MPTKKQYDHQKLLTLCLGEPVPTKRQQDRQDELLAEIDELNALITSGTLDAMDAFAMAVRFLSLAQLKHIRGVLMEDKEPIGGSNSPMGGDEYTRISQVRTILLSRLDALDEKLEDMDSRAAADFESKLIEQEQG